MNCRTLHSFVGSFINKLFNEDEEDREKCIVRFKINWEIIIDKYNEVFVNNGIEKPYEVIFVDEGQDLPYEAYDFLNMISKKVFVTFDEAQEVGVDTNSTNVKIQNYATNSILNKINVQEDFYDLFENHRNTPEIEAVAKLFYNNYKNNGVSLYTITNSKKSNDKPKVFFDISNMYKSIIVDCYQQNKKVGILYPNKEAFLEVKTVLDEYIEELELKNGKKNIIDFKYKYGKDDDTINGALDLDKVGIYLMSFTISKGHEFDSVYIPFCESIKLDNDIEKNKFYVALTRAKDSLNLFFDKNSNYSCDVLNVINSNKDLFMFDEEEDECDVF